MSTVLVTGGSGFVAGYCILQLLAADYDVRATVRNLERGNEVRAILRHAGVDPGERLSFVAADLQADAGWPEAVAGCEFVLHVASPFPAAVPANEDELIVPARDGTLRVLRAARDAGVKRVVLTSSFAAVGYGHKPREAPFDESVWTDLEAGGIAPYPKSKTLAERAAWDFIAAEGGGLELAVVNPVVVLGPLLGPDHSTSVGFLKRMLDGGLIGCPRLSFGVVDVRDVASLHVAAMTQAGARGERFIAVAGDFLPMLEIAKILRKPRRRGEKGAGAGTSGLARAPCGAAVTGAETGAARARQEQERHEREGQAHSGLGAAIGRGRDRGDRREPRGGSERSRARLTWPDRVFRPPWRIGSDRTRTRRSNLRPFRGHRCSPLSWP